MHPIRQRLLYLLLLTALPLGWVQAGVRFALGDEVEPGQHFLASTHTSHVGIIQGKWTHDVDTALLRAGEDRTLYRIPFFVPVLYRDTYTRFYHPAYRDGFLNSDSPPLLLLDLGTFHPEPWSRVPENSLDTPRRFDALPGQIVEHLRRFLTDYLPVFDRQGITEDLDPYLRLFRELAASTHDRLDRIDSMLAEIEAWLRFTQPQRTILHDWFDNRGNPGHLYHQVMDDADRAHMLNFLDKVCPAKRIFTIKWRSTGTGIAYTLKISPNSIFCRGTLSANLASEPGPGRCVRCSGVSDIEFTRSRTKSWELN